MYAIVLAGGYAKRLRPLTVGTPKALLPIAGKPILDYIMEKLQALKPLPNPIIISTNIIFQPQFEGWLAGKSYRNIEFFPDVSSSDRDKPGAVNAMADIIAKLPDEDVMVIAGDGMFRDDLMGMLEAFAEKNESVVALYEVNSIEDAKRCATVTVAKDGKILDFTEKPSEPKTKMVCGAVYLFKKGIKRQFNRYLAQKLPADQPGRFVEWLCRQQPVYGYMLADPLWDIGTPQAYDACNVCFSRRITVP